MLKQPRTTQRYEPKPAADEHALRERISIAGRIADWEIEETLRVSQTFDIEGEHNDETNFKIALYHAADQDKERARELVEPTVAEASTTLENNRRQWYELAEKLYRRGALETDDIGKILGPLPSTSPETAVERAAVKESILHGIQ